MHTPAGCDEGVTHHLFANHLVKFKTACVVVEQARGKLPYVALTDGDFVKGADSIQVSRRLVDPDVSHGSPLPSRILVTSLDGVAFQSITRQG